MIRSFPPLFLASSSDQLSLFHFSLSCHFDVIIIIIIIGQGGGGQNIYSLRFDDV